jgi:hypothetical protein
MSGRKRHPREKGPPAASPQIAPLPHLAETIRPRKHTIDLSANKYVFSDPQR